MGVSGVEGQVPGRVVAGRYRLERVLGRGGMGVVWLAVDSLIERRVALKELRAPAGVADGEESSFVERALREARNAGRLSHPGVVAVHDVIAPSGGDDAVYIVMEYVEAPTLADLIDEQGPLAAGRVAAMGAGLLDALMAAHAMGIVHRDVKPSNVLVGEGDRVKLTDFGIALAAEDSRLTRSGVMGTHGYLAPEAFDAGQVGPAADLWALGATLFHAVAGRAPFERGTTTATLRAILFEDPPAPPCPPALAEVITGLLTRPIEQRLTGDTARHELHRIATEPPNPPTADTPPTGHPDQPAWQAQATTAHRAPPPTPPLYGTTSPGHTWGQTTQPGGQPASFGPTQQTPPATPSPTQAGPAGFGQTGSGPGLPPLPAPASATGPVPSGPGPGSPRARNNTPLIIGGVVAAAAVLLIIVIVAASGGSDSDGDGGEPGTDAAAPQVSDPGGPPDLGGGDGSDEGVTGSDPAGDAGGAAGGEAAAQEFLDAVNSGDEATAMGMLCPDNREATESAVTAAMAGNTSLEIDPSETEADDSGFWARLAGTVDGEATDLGFMTTSNDGDGGWCVMQFDLGRG